MGDNNAKCVLPTSTVVKKDQKIPVNVAKKFKALLQEKDRSKTVSTITRIVKQPWKHNIDNQRQIRKMLSKLSDIQTKFSITKSNVKVGTGLRQSQSNKIRNISRWFYDCLPKNEMFATKHFTTCTIVGSGGILSGSNCGHKIDKADAVFRFNVPFTKPFEKAVGNKTTINTINRSVFTERYNSLRTSEDLTRVVDDLKEIVRDGFAWMPEFSHDREHNVSDAVIPLLVKNNLKIMFMHPDHYRAIRKHWQAWGMRILISSGFYFTSVAIQLCDEVQLYGFWPFRQGPCNQNLTYHYYNEKKITTDHSFSLEFLALVELHRLGVIKLNIEDCN
ncbi:alpha-2,8-sialyltransferase 8F-like isoform X2 [Glandiceps talaboti]